MSEGLRVVVVSSGSARFQVLHETLTAAGHVPVAYIVSLSLRPAGKADPYVVEHTRQLLGDLPPGMDLLLPGGPATMAGMLAGYRPDVLLVFGFNWKLPDEVLNLPRVAALNIHDAPLPKYRGPSPVLHAIRNGDHYLGLTVHRMTERFDAGPILAQVTDLPIPDQPTRDNIWELQKKALPGLITTALDRAVAGDPGTFQDETAKTYAGPPTPEWYKVTWDRPRHDVHNQIRMLRYLNRQPPEVTFEGRELYAERSSLIAIPSARRVQCADGPLWVEFTRRRDP